MHVAARERDASPTAPSPGALRLRRELRPLFERCAEAHAELAEKETFVRRLERLVVAVDERPAPAGARQDPVSEHHRQTRLSAEDRIRAINGAVDGMEELLAHRPDPDAWSRDEAAEWDALEGTLRVLCEP